MAYESYCYHLSLEKETNREKYGGTEIKARMNENKPLVRIIRYIDQGNRKQGSGSGMKFFVNITCNAVELQEPDDSMTASL